MSILTSQNKFLGIAIVRNDQKCQYSLYEINLL